MKVLLAGTSLHSANLGGAMTYFGSLVSGLAHISGERDLTVAVLGPQAAEEQIVTAGHGKVEFIRGDERRGVRRLLADWRRLDDTARRWGADIVHYPHEWAPPLSVPVVLTVQNIGWMHPRSRREFGLRGRALRSLSQRSVEGSRIGAVVAVSEQAASLWCELTGRERSTVVVIPEPIELPPTSPLPPDPDRFLLGIAGEFEYKNVELLLAAYVEASRCDSSLPRLRLAGPLPRGSVPPQVEQLGWVPREALLGLMSQSAGVVFPSAVESFGLPYYESLSRERPCLVLTGTPMAASRLPGTIVVEPTRAAVAVGLRSLASTPVPASTARQVIEEHAPPVIARAYVDVYHDAARVR